MGTGLHVLVPTYKFGRCTVWHFQGDGGLADPVGSSTAVVVNKKSFSIMVGVVRRIGYAASKRTANVLSLTCALALFRTSGVGQKGSLSLQSSESM